MILPLQNFDRDLVENLGKFLAGEIAVRSRRDSRRDLGEIRESRRRDRRDLIEISARLENLAGQTRSEIFGENLGEILTSLENLASQKRAEILGEIAGDLGKISARSRRHIGEISVRSWRDLGVSHRPKTRRDLRRDLDEISARSRRDPGEISARLENFAGEKRAEIPDSTFGERLTRSR